jgi:hypothetical protein
MRRFKPQRREETRRKEMAERFGGGKMRRRILRTAGEGEAKEVGWRLAFLESGDSD